MKFRLLPLVSVLVATMAKVASAEEGTAVETTAAIDHPATPPESTYKHHGFYFNLELGGGGAGIGTSANGASSTLTSGSFAGQLLLGGSLAPGLVLGGGSQGHVLTREERSMGVVGPFVTYYPDPHGGLHFTGLVGLGDIDYGSRRPDSRSIELGVGGSLGVGYDLWIGGDWSFGVTARASYLHTFSNDTTHEVNNGLAGTVLLGFTYN